MRSRASATVGCGLPDDDPRRYCPQRFCLWRWAGVTPPTSGATRRAMNFAATLAWPAHGPHAVDHRRFDLDEALVPIALRRPRCRALWQRRRDGVIHRIKALAAGQHGFCGGNALAAAVVGPIDPKDMPTVTILHGV
jgi:hypothetical protein